MKTLFFILFFTLLLCANVAFTQNSNEYQKIIQRGKDALKKEDYQAAILKYRAAEAADPSKKEEVNALIDAVFVEIEKKRVQAEEAKKRAEKAEKEAFLQTQKAQKASAETEKALRKAEEAKKQAENALIETQKQKSIADSAFAGAKKLVDAFYFYDDKFALAFKDDKFYFMDKKANKISKLGEWAKAEQFDWRGFAKVGADKTGEKYSLMDTLANVHPFTSKIEDLKEEITALDLTGKTLGTETDTVWTQKQLKVLFLNSLYIDSLPPKIGQLENLTYLDFGNNDMETLSPSISQLKNLEILYLHKNGLTNLTREIGELTNLKFLNVETNELESLPAQIGELKNLQTLVAHTNQLTSLPDQIGNLQNLQHLVLPINQLKALPEEIGNLKNLQELNIHTNQLVTLPTQIGNLKNLKHLILSINQLKTLPSEIGNLKNLQTLNLHSNQLTVLPTQIGNLKNLKYLYLGVNSLKTLPTEIGNLKNLTELYLDDNQLTTLPNWLGGLENLTELRLSGNLFDAEEIINFAKKFPHLPLKKTIADTYFSKAATDTTSYSSFKLSHYEKGIAWVEKWELQDKYEATYLSRQYNNLSYELIFAKRYAEAEAIALKALSRFENDPSITSKWVLSLLLQGKWEAIEAYLQGWKDVEVSWNETYPTYKDYYLRQMILLEKAGISHPDFEKARKILSE